MYAVLVLVPVLVLGAILNLVITREADNNALLTAQLQASAINEAGIEPVLTGRPLTEGLTATERAELVESTNEVVRSGILRLRLRDLEGRIAFDAEYPLSPPGPPIIDRGLANLLKTGVPDPELAVLNTDTVDSTQGPQVRSIEVYLPIHRRGGENETMIGALEIYVPYEPIALNRDASLRRAHIALFGGLCGLWMLLAVMVWSTSKRIHRQSKANHHLSLHDGLTGLPNRALFVDRIEHAVAQASRTALPITTAIVGLDRFKAVNDTLGHETGDQLLRALAIRMRDSLRPGDTIARLGGDEFGFVLPNVGGQAAQALLQRLRAIIADEVQLEGVPMMVEASIGWSEWPLHGETADQLLRTADHALAEAKTGRAEVVAYQEGSINADPLRLSLIAELRQALASNQLELHYQTQVDARTQMPSGVEALIRWNHPTRGRIAPDYFIPLAESTGLIGPLTRWVIETAVSQLASWGPALGDLSVAINVSARNLSEVGIAEWIVERLQFHNVDPSRVVLEVTETSFTNDEAAASAHIATLDAAGIDVSLDDFGQGYTSLSHLANLRISELKIDRSFVTGMLEEPKKRAIVASVIELGHQLGFRVVAEGVETLAVYHELRDLRCDVMQGYLFSQPLSQSLLRASLLDYRIPAKRETVPAS